MITQRDDQAKRAALAATRLRLQHGLGLDSSFCVFDFATQNLGLKVKFVKASSMEGMYVHAGESEVWLGSERPQGRQRLTCAHEIGHHIFNHGTRVDQVFEGDRSGYDGDEYVADIFSQMFLMPKTLVANGFARRGYHVDSLTPEEVYRVANWIGVGYQTMTDHMFKTLRTIQAPAYKALSKHSPKEIRARLLGSEASGELWCVDEHWVGRAVDVQVGDLLLLPKDWKFEKGLFLALEGTTATAKVIKALSPGMERIGPTEGYSHFVRVSRRQFSGRAVFRHMEDFDD